VANDIIKNHVHDIIITERLRLNLFSKKFFPVPFKKTSKKKFKIGDFVKVKWKPIYGLIITDGSIYQKLVFVNEEEIYEPTFIVKVTGWATPIEISESSLKHVKKAKQKP
jgi:hypothetical protein